MFIIQRFIMIFYNIHSLPSTDLLLYYDLWVRKEEFHEVKLASLFEKLKAYLFERL